MKKKTILVTGGAGFLGSHLIKKLIDNGYKTIIVDTLNGQGGIPYVNKKSIFLNYDICDKNLYYELDKYDISAIYHLAAQSAGEPSYDNPKYDIMTNSFGTYMVANYCLEKEIPRFIYTSTVAVYGSSSGKAFIENDMLNPDSIYGVSKLSGENFIKFLFKKSKINYSIFRVFNTYGPGENLNYRKKGMVSIYVSYLWRNEPILVKGSLNRFRDFLFIDDNIDILFQALYQEKSFNQTYNLSNGEKTYIRDLVDIMLRIFNKSSDYSVKELPNTKGDSFGTNGSIKKLSYDFDWRPKFSLNDGLEKYYNWISKIPLKEDLVGYHPLHLKNKNEK